MSPPPLTVDAEHLGPGEDAWRAAGLPGVLADLDVPAARRVLVLAPHPDDEVLGAGGLLQVVGARPGVAVEVVAVTDGEAAFGPVTQDVADELRRIRSAESVAALARLGLGAFPRHRLGLPDGGVADRVDVLSRWLRDRVDGDTLCIAPWAGDGHPDHDAVGAATTRAAAAAGAPALGYLVWAWHWATPGSDQIPWASCRALELSPTQAAAKGAAVATFDSQINVPTGPDALPVLPAAVLRRFQRNWEVYVT